MQIDTNESLSHRNSGDQFQSHETMKNSLKRFRENLCDLLILCQKFMVRYLRSSKAFFDIKHYQEINYKYNFRNLK